MPFWNGSYPDYSRKPPSPQLQEFHERIIEIKECFLGARAKIKDLKTMDIEERENLVALNKEGKDLKIKFLTNMIEYCLRNDVEGIPIHLDIEPNLWDAAMFLLKEQAKASEEYRASPSELDKMLRDRVEYEGVNCRFRYNRNGVDADFMEGEFVGPDSLTYWVQCGPLRCGERGANDRCTHGLCWFQYRPPTWADGSGWAHYRNPFQIASAGDWQRARFEWVGGRRLPPRYGGPDGHTRELE